MNYRYNGYFGGQCPPYRCLDFYAQAQAMPTIIKADSYIFVDEEN